MYLIFIGPDIYLCLSVAWLKSVRSRNGDGSHPLGVIVVNLGCNTTDN